VAVPDPSLSQAAATSEPDQASGTILRARFVDGSGNPLAGVALRALADGGHVTSDARGEAALELFAGFFAGLPAAIVTLEARATGFATAQRNVPWKAGESGWIEEWELLADGSVAGRVVDERGRGVADVRVARLLATIREQDWEARRSAPLEDLAESGAQATTESDGSFVLESVPAGATRLVAVAEDGRSALSEPIDIPVGDTLRDVEIRLGGASPRLAISGSVVGPDDRPVSRARIELRTASRNTLRYADEDGRFRFDLRDDDPCRLTAFDPEQRLRQAEIDGIEPPSANLVLRLTRGPELELTVLAKGREPIESFRASVVAARDERNLASYPEVERPEGVLRLGVPAQAFLVEVHANGWLPARLGPFDPEAAPPRAEARLEPASGLTGKVEASGAPVGGARVALHRVPAHERTYNGFPLRMEHLAANDSRTREDGTFLVSVEEAGSYFARVEADGFAPSEGGPWLLDPKSTREETFVLGPGGAIEVQLRSSEARGTSGVLVAVSHGDGQATTRRTGEDGRVAFERLTPGRWQVAEVAKEIDPRYGVMQDSTEPLRDVPWNCEVFAGETTRIDLWLEDAGEGRCRLGGRFTIDGKPAEGWLASLQMDREAQGRPQPMTAPGVFRLSADAPGAYRLFLRTDAADPADVLVILDPLELVEGESFWSLELTMGSLEGTSHTAPASAAAPLYHLWERGDLQCLAAIVSDAEGRFRCARVPAGNGRIVRFAPDAGGGEPEPETLLEVVVEPGKSKKVEF